MHGRVLDCSHIHGRALGHTEQSVRELAEW